jgi:hypothetical protein
LFDWIKDNIDAAVAYSEGQEFGDAWKEQGGEDINDEALRRWHINNGYEGNWVAFNRGVRSVLGGSSSDEE